MKFQLYQELREILYLQNYKSNPDAYKFLGVFGHIGIDINFGHLDGIKSGFDGTVIYVSNDSIVILTEPDNQWNCLEVVYSHGEEFRFEAGDKVKAGDVLCLQDSSGPTVFVDESWSHLHLGIRQVQLTQNYQNQNLKWNFAYYSLIKYQVLNIDNGFEGFIDPNLYCERVLIKIAKAIEKMENNNLQNNPGSIKGLDGKFLKFNSYQEGFSYLCNYLERAVIGKHLAYRKDFTIYDFFKVYAPSLDNNNPLNYAKNVVEWVGLNGINDKISDWLLTELDWIKKYNNAESIIYPMPKTGNQEKDNQIEQFNFIVYLFKKLWSIIFKDK